MNVLGGALYGHIPGFLLVSLLTATGASLCYLLSALIAKPLVDRFAHGRVQNLQRQLQQHRQDLFYYLLFTRMFPFTPNWFINMASPHVKIPIRLFFVTMFLGLLPYNFITAGAGDILSEVSTLSDIMHPSVMIKLGLVACVVLMMPSMKRRLSAAREKRSKSKL